MNKIIFNIVIASLIAINLSNIYANEKGNGGGGVKENGVYKTFYSAGVIIKSEPETEIPGSDIYLKTIQSLVPSGDLSTRLITSALPMGDRSFYRILDNQMDKALMDRLLTEYTKVTNRPNNNLAIFAITDTNEQVTYLLPSFYLLSKTEQAAILFHEAYWIMYPNANYAEVVNAEMTFQEYIEKTSMGIFSSKLPRLLGKLTEVKTLALSASLRSDVKNKNASRLIDSSGNLLIGDLFQSNCEITSSDFPWTLDSTMLSMSIYCTLGKKDISSVISLSLKYPKSVFLKEMIEYLALDNQLSYSEHYREEVSERDHNKIEKNNRNEFYSYHSLGLF